MAGSKSPSACSGSCLRSSLTLAHRVYVATAGALALDGAPSLALRFFLAAIVLLIPTTLMGGTLPALTRAFMGVERDRLKSSVSRLYGLNTLGAMVGTALAGFFLIEHVGIRASLWGTATVNVVLGVAALAAGPSLRAELSARPPRSGRAARGTYGPSRSLSSPSRRLRPCSTKSPGPACS